MNKIIIPKRILALLLSLCILLGTLPIMYTAFAEKTDGEILTNTELNFTEQNGVYTLEGWGISADNANRTHRVYTDSNGVNVVEMQSIHADTAIALTSTVKLNEALSKDKYYKFSVWMKLEAPTMTDSSGNPVTFYRAYGGAYMFYKHSNQDVYKSDIITAQTDWQQYSFIIDASKVHTGGWDYFFGVRLTGVRGKLSVKLPSITEYAPDALDIKADILTPDLFDSIDVDIQDFTLPSSTVLNSSEQTTVTLNGVENVPAIKINTANKNENYDVYYWLWHDNNKKLKLDANKKYRFTVWVKADITSYNASQTYGVRAVFCNGNTWYTGAVCQTFGQWQKLEYIIDTESFQWQYRVGVRVYAAGGDIYIADAQLTEYVGAVSVADENREAQSIVSNGDFETNNTTEGTFTGWSFYTNNTSKCSQSVVEGFTGKALMISTATSDFSLTNTSTTVTVDPNKDYVAKVRIKATANANGTWQAPSWGGNIRMEISDPSGKMATVSTTHISAQCDWTELSVNVTDIPSDVTTLKIALKVGSTGCNAYFDDVRLIPLTNGTVTVNRNNAYAGDTVEVKMEAAEGYELSSLYYTTNGVDKVNITEAKQTVAVSATVGGFDGTVYKSIASDKIYSFIMPANTDVTVKAEFVEEGTSPNPDPTPTPDPEPEPQGFGFINGGFEEFSGGEFTGWTFSNGGNSANSITQQAGRTGKAAVVSDTNNDHTLTVSQSVEIDSTKDYKISFYIRATEHPEKGFSYVWGGARIKVDAGSYKAESTKITSPAGYRKYSLVVKGAELPANTTSIKVSFVVAGMRGLFYLDDAVIEEYNGEALERFDDLYNLSFEYGEGDSLEDWKKNIAKDTVTIGATADAQHGTRAAVIKSTHRQNVASVSQTINNIDSTKRYLLTAYAKSGTLDVSYSGGGIKVGIKYKDANGKTVSVNSSGTKNLENWTQLKCYFQIPQNASDVNAYLLADSLAGEVIFDNVSLTVVGDAIVAEEGQFANNGFEIFYDGEFPMWSFNNGGNAKNSIAQGEGRTGKAAIITDTNTDHILSLSQSIELDRTKDYRITFYVKALATDEQDFYVPSWGGAYVKASAGDYTVVSSEITAPTRYKRVSVIIEGSKLPDDTSSVRVSFVMEYLRGVFYLDDVTVAEYNGEPEPVEKLDDLYNLSFEEGTGNSFDDWTKKIPNSKVTITATDDAYDGDRAVLFTSTDRNNVASVYQPINNSDPQYRYRITAYAKTLSKPDVAYDGGGIKLRVSYTDKNGNTVNNTSAGKRELSDWTKLYVDYQIPEGATNVQLSLVIDCLKGEVVFDKIILENIGKAVVMPVQDPLNLAPNFSFENGQDGSFPGWYYWGNSAKNCSCETGEPRSGAQSAKLINQDTANSSQLSWDTTKLDTTKYYQFTAWVKTTDVVPLVNGQGGVRINIQFKKSGSNDNIKTYASEYIIGTNGWTQLKVIGKFPEGCTRAVFALSLSQASGKVCFDDVDIRVVDYVETNLLKNGDFTDLDEDGALISWESNTNDWAFASFSAEDGLAIVENSNFCTSYYYQTVENLELTRSYVLSGSIASSYLVSNTAGGAVIAEFIDVYGNVIETWRCSEYLTDTSDGFVKFAAELTFPEGCKTMRVLLAAVDSVGIVKFSGLKLCYKEDHTGDEAVSPLKIKPLDMNVIDSIKAPAVDNGTVTDKGIDFVLIGIICAAALVISGGAVTTVIIIRKKRIVKF